jgi:hypothetical protein
MSYEEYDDEDSASNFSQGLLSNLTEMSDNNLSISTKVDNSVFENDSVLKYISESQKKSDTR